MSKTPKVKFRRWKQNTDTMVKVVCWDGVVLGEGPINKAFAFVEKSVKLTKMLLVEVDGMRGIDFIYSDNGSLVSYCMDVV